MAVLSEIVKNKSFWEKVLLLIVGATITGIFVPIVKSSMDEKNFEQQKIFEATVARQAEILKTQSDFLGAFSEYVWEFQLAALQVTYYHASSEKLFKKAVSNYEENSWLYLKKIRSAVGGARWFTSDSTYSLLTEFIDGWLLYKIDITLMDMLRNGKNAKWNAFHRTLFSESIIRTNAILLALARDYGLDPSLTETMFSAEESEKKMSVEK